MFRNEVFGTKYKGGTVKSQDWVRVSMMLSTCPYELAGIEIIYVDRGMMDHISYMVKQGAEPGAAAVQELQVILQQGELPPASYEKDWTNPERVAKLLADGRITKTSYEEYKKSGTGGDWQCRTCPYLKQCYNDSRVMR